MPTGSIGYDRLGNRRYSVDGAEVTKEQFDAAFPPKWTVGDALGVPFAGSKAAWPKRSEALAVHPSQVNEANARAVREGLGTRYEPDGIAVIPSRAERKKLLRVERMHDKGGSYGD